MSFHPRTDDIAGRKQDGPPTPRLQLDAPDDPAVDRHQQDGSKDGDELL